VHEVDAVGLGGVDDAPGQHEFAGHPGADDALGLFYLKDLQTGAVTTVTEAQDGSDANQYVGAYAYFSADGTKVAFTSNATNLTSDGSLGSIYVKDLTDGSVAVADLGVGGQNPDSWSGLTSRPWSPIGSQLLFVSNASNLINNDTNGYTDAFIYDTETGLTTNASRNANGDLANYPTEQAAWSSTGRYLTLYSNATNYIVGGTNDPSRGWFIKDLDTGAVQIMVSDSNGDPGDAAGGYQSWSPDGEHIAFISEATDLVPGDTNGIVDVFVKDVATGTTSRVSMGAGGAQATGPTSPYYGQWGSTSWSPDGKSVLYLSTSTNLVDGDTNGFVDVFLTNVANGQTTRLNTAADGTQADGPPTGMALFSPVGSRIAFTSDATNLVPGDTNNSWDIFIKVLDPGA
jgi:Tol biopolymer transport system component